MSDTTDQFVTTDTHKPNPTDPPETKFGPFDGGHSVEVWLNRTPDDRFFRSITISPPTHKDENGHWQSPRGYRPKNLSALILALQNAESYCNTTPLPGPPPTVDPDF